MKKKLTQAFFEYRKWLLINIMRTFIFLLCTTAALGFSSNNVLSQNSKVKIDTDKTVSVDEVFKIISDQTDYKFIYQSNLFENFPKVNLKKGIVKANKLLKMSFLKGSLNFSFSNENTIVITEKPNRLQEKTISGRVTDIEGNPMVGVNILINVNEKGTSTGFEGNYEINVTEEDIIRFTYLGYASQEFIIAEQTTINVVLLEASFELEEVVVTTGYQKVTKERATGSFGTLKSEQLEKRVASNILTELAGSVSGVLVQGDNIIIRGHNTFRANTQPLIVIDGFPVESDQFFRNNGNSRNITSLVNSDDVESITVLKDAAAASIWGARASNGVIVITTKKAEGKKISVNFSTRLKVVEQTNWDKTKYVSTSTIIDAQLLGLENGIGVPSATGRRNAIQDLWHQLDQNVIDQTQFDNSVNSLRNINGRKNFQNAFERNNFRQEYNLNVSGGSDFHDFYISGKFINRSLTRKDQSNRDINLNIKNNFKIGKKIKINSSVFVKRFNSESGLAPTIFNAYDRFINPDGTATVHQRTYSNDEKEIFTNMGYVNWDYKPLEDVNHTISTNESTNIRFQLGLDVEILKELIYTSGFQYEYGTNNNLTVSNKLAYNNRSLYNQYTTATDNGDGTFSLNPQILLAGTRDGDEFIINNYTWRNQLDYNKFFGIHQINALAGIETRKLNYNFVNPPIARGYDDQLLTSSLYFDDIETIEGNTVSLRPGITSFLERENRYLSYYANVGYTYDGKYDITGSYRLDLTNFFGVDPKFRYRPLWSAGLGWNISKEDFFNVSWVDYLRFRTTYGLNGNSSLSNGSFLRIAAFTDAQGFPTASITSPPNPGLRWEKTAVTNFGIDFSLFNKLNGSIEYYYKYSSDLLGRVPIDYTSGFPTALLNTSELSNRGIDLNLNYNIFNKDFKWDINTNFAWNKGKVEKYLLDNPTANQLISEETEFRNLGDPINALYAYRWAGLNEEGDPTFFTEEGTILEALKGNFGENAGDLEFIGSRTPTTFGGIRNFFSYKGFSLNVFVDYTLGHYKRVPTVNLTLTGVSSSLLHEDYLLRWQNSGDELTTNVPRQLVAGRDDRIFRTANHLVARADQIFLQEISLGYSFPQKFLNKTSFKSLYLSLHANNIGYLYVAKNTNRLPFNATYTFNVHFNF